MGFIYKSYSSIFAKKLFLPIHKRIYLFALRGLGFLNSENGYISGEKFVLKYLTTKNIKTIFDVGANTGQFANLILGANIESDIYSFEPNPSSFVKLNQIKNKNFKAFNKGLGNENSKMILYDYNKEGGSEHAALHKDVIIGIHDGEAIEIEVDIIKLDDFCNENKIEKIDFLKIDVEGFELDVLKGARRMLNENKIKYIQFEFNTNNLISRTTFRDFELILENYDLFRLLPDGLIKLNNEKMIFKEIYLFQNIFAILKNEKTR